jgi:uncharacterized membrane protein
MPRHHLSREEFEKIRRERLSECKNPHLADVVERNIGTILDLRHQVEEGKTFQDHVADLITNFSGSMAFLYAHAVWFGVWIAINLNWIPGMKAFDPYPFGLLTMIVSLEAIFLSTFVLISQNRMGALADQRADLDLQINLLAEYEITRILRLVDAMAQQMGIEDAGDSELEELKLATAPDLLTNEIHSREAIAKTLDKLARKGSLIE